MRGEGLRSFGRIGEFGETVSPPLPACLASSAKGCGGLRFTPVVGFFFPVWGVPVGFLRGERLFVFGWLTFDLV